MLFGATLPALHPETVIPLDIPQVLGTLALMLLVAKVMGGLAQKIGQPAVLGELLGGVLLSASVLGVVDLRPNLEHKVIDLNLEVVHLLAEVGVVVLLFEIGLETDLKKLLKVGGASTCVALVGVVLPFVFGYAACRLLGLANLVAIVAGASLTATSVGITARVLSDLGRSQEPESQIILGAAVLDDILGLIILGVVIDLTNGSEPSLASVALITARAFGFLIVTLLVGSFLVPYLARWVRNWDIPRTVTMLAVMLALGLAWLANNLGSAMIIGAFASGLLLARTPQAHGIARGVAQLGHFFVPLFFMGVGAAVDVRVFNPLNPDNHRTLMIGALLIILAVLGKFLAGYAPFWFKGKKHVIGVGMVPRGEVGLIFAAMGLTSHVLDPRMFGALTLMVLVTTFMVPPLLTLTFPRIPVPSPAAPAEGIEELVTEA